MYILTNTYYILVKLIHLENKNKVGCGVYIIIREFCVALADSVPGISGGTEAFILGFYDNFVNYLNNLILGNKTDIIQAFKFLSK